MALGDILHHVFVDFENVPEIDLGLVAGKPVQVTLLIGKNQTKLPTSFSLQLHRHAAQVQPVEVGGSGRNALDLTLACYLGQAIQQWPAAQFHIVSGDRDFEPMIAHFVAKKILVARYEAFHLLPFVARPKPASGKKAVPPKNAPPPKPTPVERCDRVIARLTDPANANRPSTRKALLAHLKASLGKESSDAAVADCLARLEQKHGLRFDANNKATWR